MKILLLVLIFNIHTVFAGTYSKYLWPNNEVVVCFAKGEKKKRETPEAYLKVRDWIETNKLSVKSWVNEEYSSKRTGIYFTGWKDCEETPEAEVIIFFNKNNKILTSIFGGLHGLASIGPKGGVAGYPAAQACASISETGMKKGTVVHEFGHVAGLGHEHNHPDSATGKKACEIINPQTIVTFLYEEYDVESIMSYCSLHLENRMTLSKKDLALLRKIYP